MKNEFYQNHNLAIKEKGSKFGKALLYIGFFISCILTVVIIFFIVINNLGISPNDQYGFKVIRKDVAQGIVDSFNMDTIKSAKTVTFDIKNKDTYLYHFKYETNEQSTVYEFYNISEEYKVTLDHLNKEIQVEGKNTSISSYENGMQKFNELNNNYLENYALFNSNYYKDITQETKDTPWYYYNEEKKLLKFAKTSDEFIICDENGIVKQAGVNLYGSSNSVYKILNEVVI